VEEELVELALEVMVQLQLFQQLHPLVEGVEELRKMFLMTLLEILVDLVVEVTLVELVELEIHLLFLLLKVTLVELVLHSHGILLLQQVVEEELVERDQQVLMTHLVRIMEVQVDLE
jgi:hypothetical protein